MSANVVAASRNYRNEGSHPLGKFSSITTADYHWQNDSLTYFAVKPGVEMIGDNAFWYCTALKDFVATEGIRKVGKYAFGMCLALKEMTFKCGLREVDDAAFERCAKLKTLTISLKDGKRARFHRGAFRSLHREGSYPLQLHKLRFTDVPSSSSGVAGASVVHEYKFPKCARMFPHAFIHAKQEELLPHASWEPTSWKEPDSGPSSKVATASDPHGDARSVACSVVRAKQDVLWFQCERCEKWRITTDATFEVAGDVSFYCEMHPEAAIASCESPDTEHHRHLKREYESKTYHIARENETAREIATNYGLDVRALVKLNKKTYPALSAKRRLKEGTKLELPPTATGIGDPMAAERNTEATAANGSSSKIADLRDASTTAHIAAAAAAAAAGPTAVSRGAAARDIVDVAATEEAPMGSSLKRPPKDELLKALAIARAKDKEDLFENDPFVEIAPSGQSAYTSKVKERLWLKLIEQRVQSDAYSTFQALMDDMCTMVSNVHAVFGKRNTLGRQASKFWKDTERELQKLKRHVRAITNGPPQKDKLREILTRARKNKGANVFETSPLGYPNYSTSIKVPMWFKRIEEKIENGEYTDVSLFNKDLNLIVANCKTFNGAKSPFTKMAQAIKKNVQPMLRALEQWQYS
eukprot:g5075.t1